jgi:hypothetical protein
MKTVTIPQKMSGTGTIHDTASQNFDREIRFPTGHKYAVVLAAYYGGKGYTTHASAEATIKASRKNREYSHVIIDSDDNHYTIVDDQLLMH